MNHRKTYSKHLGGVVAVLLLCGCETQPTSPSSPQQPPPPPPQQQAQQQEREAQQQQQSQSQASTEANEQSAPPSPEKAPAAQAQNETAPDEAAEQSQSAAPTPQRETKDVEITDIPLDENGDPIVQKTPPPSAPNPSDESQAAASSSGGAEMPGGAQQRQSGGGAVAGATEFEGPDVQLGATTAGERGAALEQELQTKLEEFDELMRKAREDAEAEGGAGGDGLGGGSYAASGGQGGRKTPPPNGRGEGGSSTISSGGGQTPDITGRSGRGKYQNPTGTPPPDVADAHDDDIVARQLREAATRETDPVLQEKLWQEYRKYKQGTGR